MSYPFDMLAFVPPPSLDPHSGVYFGIPFSMEKDWNVLADDLLETAAILIARYSIPAVAPYTAKAWKYGAPHRTYAQARIAAFRGRDWFMVWAGLIGFCIRFIEDHRKTQINTVIRDPESHLPPHWRVQLRERGFSYAWIDGMELVAHAEVDRAGLFIENVSEDPQKIFNGDPSFTWWLRCGVPFWMRWESDLWDSLQTSDYTWLLPGRDTWVFAGGLISEPEGDDNIGFEREAANGGYQAAEDEAEREFILMSKERSPQEQQLVRASSESSFPASEIPPCGKDQASCESDPWAHPDNILARVQLSRDRLAEQIRIDTSLRAAESLQQRRKRLDREIEPPVVNAKVLVFELDYDNPTKMTIHTVRKKERAGTLRRFSIEQKHFLSSLNIWYCCEEWAPGKCASPDDGDHGLDIEYQHPPIHAHSPDRLVGGSPTSEHSESNIVPPKESALQGRATDDLEDHDQPSDPQVLPDVNSSSHGAFPSLEDSILKNLTLLYGFVLPLPKSHNSPKLLLDTKKQAIFMRQLGYALNRPGVDNFIAGSNALPVHKFVTARTAPTMQYSEEVKEMHDLHDQCYLRMGTSDLARLKKVQTSTKLFLGDKEPASTWYLYDFGRGWAIAVDRPEAALTLCRLGRSEDTMEGMMRALVEMGFRFRTVGWMIESTLGSLPAPCECSLPERRSDHIFHPRDYQEYLQILDGVFTDPRMRAAVLRGGVIWRIAYSFVGLEPVIGGPTYQKGLVMQNKLNNDMYIDDDLTAAELRLIVGTYKCWTGLGSQTTLKSWWPPVEAFEGPTCGENYGLWNDFRERWYEDRRSKILAGQVQPLTTDEWKRTLKGRKEVTFLKKRMHCEAEEFLSRHDLS